MMHCIRTFAAATLALATFIAVGATSAGAQSIEKIQNKSLAGSAYARLRGATAAQCEERCLRDTQCVAFEYFKGAGSVQRSSNCALFSTTRGARDSAFSDIGYKRGAVASGDRPAPKRSALPEVPDNGRPGSSRFAPPHPLRVPPPNAPSAASQAEQSERALAEQARRASEERVRAEYERARQFAGDAQRRERTGQARSPAPATAPSSEPSGGSGGSGAVAATPAPSAAAPPATRGLTPTAPRPPTAPITRNGEPRGATRSASPVAPAAAAPAAPPDFHIVPVFYGTDRNRADTTKRIAYANDRARRLEMGQALVTVPSNHKVPNIERPSAWNIPYFGKIWEEAEDPKKHFTIREISAKSKIELLALVKQRLGGSEAFKNQSIVFIHGYNIGFDDALYRTAQISFDLQFDGATYSYSWPSGSGWASYPYARDSAQQAEPYLYEFLQMVQNETGTTSISIVAHSMGNQMLLQVLRSLKQRSPDVSKINQIVLAAPDVDRDAFEFLASEIRGVAKGITLYAAGNDVALEASRYLAGNKPRAGDVPPSGPVVVAGIDTIDISSVSTGYLAINHSNYAEHSELLTDLKHLIRSGIRPPELRITAYKRIQGEQGIYWRYGN